MLINNIKIALRNILKNKNLFFINVGGLAIGFAACLLIMFFVMDEWSFDRYNEHADQIVRVVLRGKVKDEAIKEACTPAPVAPTLLEEFPEVIKATRIRSFGTEKVTYHGNLFRDNRFAYVDPGFFGFFTLHMIKGDPATVLERPNTIVITQGEALKIFGNEDPLGKTLEFNDMGRQMEITGIVENVPANSHFHFDIFASMEGFENAKIPIWMESNYHNYLMLKKGTDYKEVEAKLPAIVEKYMGAQVQEAMGISFSEFKEMGNDVGLFLQPLTDIHLRSDFSGNSQLEQGSEIKTVYIFTVVALFILLIACVNFMNLSTASATRRAKEVGIKKVLGSKKDQLVAQFMTESFLSTLAAMFLALLLAALALPFFNSLSGKEIYLTTLLAPQVLLLALLFVVMITILAGSYPSFLLSSFKPVHTLKSKWSDTGDSKGIRSGLVVFQFVISSGLIIAMLVVSRQLHYIQNKDVGYDRDQILVMRDSEVPGKEESTFKSILQNDPRVQYVTQSGYVPAGPSNNSMAGIYPDQDSPDFRRTTIYGVDDQYIPTLGMKLIRGRNFSSDYGAEASHVILNETAAKIFGIADDPLGKSIVMATDNKGGRKQLTVIGVVHDFHFRSLHQVIDPMIMLYNPNGGLIVRAKTSDMAGLIASAKKEWTKLSSGEPFTYALLDDLYNKTYVADQKVGDVLEVFTLLTIFVACLGLFGLVTFTAEQKFKEIGIRKVLGSTVSQVVILLTKDLIKLVLISFFVAFPLGYYLMKWWLQDFAYRIEIQWWFFAAAGMITLLIAFITMSLKTVRSALVNPVDSIRDE